MKIVERILKREIKTNLIEININFTNNRISNIFSTLILGDFMSYFLSEFYNNNPEKGEIIEKIKKLMSQV